MKEAVLHACSLAEEEEADPNVPRCLFPPPRRLLPNMHTYSTGQQFCVHAWWAMTRAACMHA